MNKPYIKKGIRLLCLMMLIGSLSACSVDYDDMAEQRLSWARQAKGPIKIIAIGTDTRTNFIKGILLAAEEINLSKEKLLGRELEIQAEKDGGSFEASKPLIRRIVSDPTVTAVLGHRSSSIAMPASVLYERSQVIFLSSFSTSKMLTGHGFKYVFRMAPNNEVMAQQLASAASILGYKKMVILYGRSDLSRELAFMFEDAALKQGIEFTKRSSFFEGDTNYRNIISQINSEPFDAIFISSGSTSSARMATQLRGMGLDTPIVGTDSLNSASYGRLAGEFANKTLIPSLYQPDRDDAIVHRFKQRYKAKYGVDPDYNAAQGYDSLRLLSNAIKRSESTLTPLVSSTLRFMPAWVGVTGIHDFDQTGELLGKKYFFRTWREGELQSLPALHNDYFLGRFEKQLQERFSRERKVTEFQKAFSEPMHEDENNLYLLDLAHEVLQFKRLGVIYENTDKGKKLANEPLLQRLVKQKNLELVACEVPFSLLTPAEIKDAMLSCYGKLSLESDAIFIPSYLQTSPRYQEQLNAGLAFFKIPTITLNNRTTDPHISLVMSKRNDVNKTTIGYFNGLLHNQKIHEFSERLGRMPEITANLADLQNMGIPDDPILLLSPDRYVQTEALIKTGTSEKNGAKP
jgi:ABC-type branched-subunit amino acid transport system substrate-binding protein